MKNALRLLCSVSLGAAGGAVFFAFHMPMAWLLGALFVTGLLSMLGARLYAPKQVRTAVVSVIGVMLGSNVTPDVLGHLSSYGYAFLFLPVFTVVIGAISLTIYRVFGKLDWATAYCSAMPGGLIEMLSLGESENADTRYIILSHSLRVVITVALVSLWFKVVMEIAPGRQLNVTNLPAAVDMLLLAACAILGSVLGVKLKFPAPTFLGPLLLSAVIHVTGVTAARPPDLIVSAAQIMLGSVLGCRFVGFRPKFVARVATLTFTSTVVCFAVAFAFALLFRALFDFPMLPSLLALAPGGLSEMGLIAMAVGADVNLIILLHVGRTTLVLLAGRPAFRLLQRRLPS